MILPNARDCADITASSGTGNAYFCLVTKAIIDALATAGTYSATVTTSGKANADVIAVMNALDVAGFTSSISGTTLTISWANS